jgi:tetratricopeptide (TPR) repeat protein
LAKRWPMPPVDDSVGRYRQKMSDIESTLYHDEANLAAQREAQRDEQRREVVALKEDGNAKFKEGKLAEAVRLYTLALETDFLVGNDDKLTAVLYSNRAAARLRQAEIGFDDEWELAERDCRRSLERDPTVKCHMRCARALSEGLGRPDDAFECLAEALVLEPANSAVRDALAALRAASADAERLTASATTLERLRRRGALKEERGHAKLATAYADAVALLTSQPSEPAEPAPA